MTYVVLLFMANLAVLFLLTFYLIKGVRKTHKVLTPGVKVHHAYTPSIMRLLAAQLMSFQTGCLRYYTHQISAADVSFRAWVTACYLEMQVILNGTIYC